MDYKEEYEKLLNSVKEMEKELEFFRSGHQAVKLSDNELISGVFHSVDQLIAINNLETGKFIDINNSFLKILGYNKEEIIGFHPDEIKTLADKNAITDYFKLVTEQAKIKKYQINLYTRQGKNISFLLSAEKFHFGDKNCILSVFREISTSKYKTIKEIRGSILDEILDTVSSYLALYSIGDDNRFYIVDLNTRVEEVEFIRKSEVIGKCIDDTPLVNRVKLMELLRYLRITGSAHKLSVSPAGDDSEGYYMGFILTSGNIVVTWEPGIMQKNLEDLNKQGIIFEKFAEMLPESIFEMDLTGKISYVNRKGLDFFGYTRDDIGKGFHISELFPDDYFRMSVTLKALTSPGETSVDEFTARRKDGTPVTVMIHSFARFLNDRIIGYRGVITDISKHREYENRINREKAFLEHLIDSTPEAIAIIDASGNISMINKEFIKLFGYSPEEAINRHINDLIVPEEMRDEALAIDELVRTNGKEVRQTIRRSKSGILFHVSLIATTVTINNEVVASLGIYRDITLERRNQLLQEILYNITTSALKQSEIKDIYPIIVREIGKVWNTNNFFIALYDKKSATLSLPFFADEKDSFIEIPLKNTVTGWVINNNRSVLLKEKDLKILEEKGEVELVGTPSKVWMGVILRVENDIIGVMCFQDYNDENAFSKDDLYLLEFISNQIALAIQRRLMLDSLIIARQKAEEAALAKQQFMSTMSHEIRTPLNEVIGITNLLLKDNPRPDQMDYIKTLKFSGNHLLTLVNDVLDYNKMESGKIIFEQIQFNLNDFLDEIMRSFSFRSKAKHIKFDITKSGNLPEEVIGDPIRLNQILSNLLSNALKFTYQGSIKVEIREISRTGNQSRLEFSVSDTGIGIAGEHQSIIFESFTQASADTSRHFGGTGLGLAICKKLVELQGGVITVTSEPGKGSTFRFSIPFMVMRKNGIITAAEPVKDFTGLEGKRILVAEDNKINFFVASKFLTGWGVTVTHAENGQLVLEILEKEDFDLILMDLQMPVMDGIEATRIIRNSDDPKIKNIPIVALTAAIMSENHDRIDNLRISDYVLKPFKPHDLFERILKNVR
jgi:PAS domain S-box-containing protein